MRTGPFSAFLFSLSACSPQYGVQLKSGTLEESAFAETPDEEVTEDLTIYEGAVIRIVSPASGDFLAFGESHEFEAVITNAAGDEIPVEGIAWNSDADDRWSLAGAQVEDDTIDVGTHNLTAEVELPDGARLAHTIGGVLVQHEYAGTYVGDMVLSLDASFGETPVGTSCIGSAIVVVDTYGEIAEGSSECTLDLLGYASFDVAHEFAYDIDDSDLDGDALVAIPFLGFDLPFSSSGNLDDETITTEWEGGFGGSFQLDGVLEVTRLTRDVTQL